VGLHICHVVRRGHDQRGEWVEVANNGPAAVSLTDLEITDYTETQAQAHIYRFPGTTTGGALKLPPGKSAFVFTRRGDNAWSNTGNLLLFWGRQSDVWNNSGDVAYLRKADGTFVDHMTVGHPKRHPAGH
jgi:hypothetical protein